MSAKPAFDPEVLLAQTAGDAALADELIQLCLTEFPGLRDQIRSAVSERDPVQLKFSAHTLAGSLVNFGAQRAVDALHALETMGRENNLEGVERSHQELESALADFERELVAHFR